MGKKSNFILPIEGLKEIKKKVHCYNIMDSLVKYYDKLWREYRRYLNRILHSTDADTIHELRIVIKKIRALFHLLTFSNFDFDKHFAPMATIFKAVGKIRDIDVTLQSLTLIAKDSSAAEFKNITKLLQKKRRSNIPPAKRIAGDLLRSKYSFDSEAELRYTATIDKTVKLYFRQLQKEIENEIRKRLTDKRLHNIRKLYKEYLFVSKAAAMRFKNLPQVNKLQKRIGEWHDLLIAVRTAKDIVKERSRKETFLGSLKKEEKKFKKKAVQEIKSGVMVGSKTNPK